jgi:hypothetical protein
MPAQDEPFRHDQVWNPTQPGDRLICRFKQYPDDLAPIHMGSFRTHGSRPRSDGDVGTRRAEPRPSSGESSSGAASPSYSSHGSNSGEQRTAKPRP